MVNLGYYNFPVVHDGVCFIYIALGFSPNYLLYYYSKAWINILVVWAKALKIIFYTPALKGRVIIIRDLINQNPAFFIIPLSFGEGVRG